MHLVFSKFRARDFADYLLLVTDARVMAMITERPLSLAEAQEGYADLLRNNALHPALGSFRVQDGQGRFVGLGKLVIETAGSRRAELGYMLLPRCCGQGIGTAIANELLARAAEQGITEIFAIIDPANAASRRILCGQGFVHQECCDFDGLPGEILVRTSA